MTLKEFKDFYHKKNYLPFHIYFNPKIKLSNNQLEKKYDKYLNKVEKENQKREDKILDYRIENLSKIINNEKDIDEKWVDLKEEIKLRDNNQCRLMKVLSVEESNQLFDLAPSFLLNELESAHCISRAKSKNLYYEKRNVYLINKYSHRNLDSFRCPITSKNISKEEVVNWWVRIIGKEEYIWLCENM